jgi:hypothetical protein
MSFFMVFVSPVTFKLIGCVDLFSTEACEEAPGKRRENHLPDGIVKVVTSSIMAGLSDFASDTRASTEERGVVSFFHN